MNKYTEEAWEEADKRFKLMKNSERMISSPMQFIELKNEDK